MTPHLYRHLQRAPWLLLALLLPAVALVAIVVSEGEPALSLLALLLVVPAAIFHRLETRVDGERVEAAFGWGWPRLSLPLEELVEARAVRNPWYWGFGIRWTPAGWMYNVSGLDAVELTLTRRRRYRIGTDDPEGLLAAVEGARQAHDEHS